MTIRIPILAAALVAASAPPIGAQVPADLRAASIARNAAVERADAATWDRLTSDSFTVFGVTNHVMTKAQRLAQLRQQSPTGPRRVSEGQWQRAGNAFVHRYQIGDFMVQEVWAKERNVWRVASVQTSVIAPDSAVVARAIDSSNAAFATALTHGDLAALVATYTDNAVVMESNTSAWEGREGIRQGITGFLSQFTFSDARIQRHDIVISGNYVFERGSFAWTLHPKAGAGPDVVDNGKYLVVWERQGDGSWKILRDIGNSDRPGPM